MILTRLTVCNFRSFRGTHTVNLRTSNCTNTRQPVVLIGGLNGAGKTTLFLAIKLALYGRATEAGGFTTLGYSSFIRSCIHRYTNAILQPNTAFVELELRFGRLGNQFTYRVQRNWEFVDSKLNETIHIWENGKKQTSVIQSDAQNFIRELVPQGIFNLFFFDGERIELLAKDSTGSVLQNAFEVLFGLNLVERLRSDLKTYLRNNVTPLQNDPTDTQKTQAEYDLLRSELDVAQDQLQGLVKQFEEYQYQKHQLESQIRSNSGDRAESHPSCQTRVNDLTHLLGQQKHALREVVAGVFPLSLADDTIQLLHREVANDFKNMLNQHAFETVQQFVDAVRILLDPNGQRVLDSELVEWQKKHVDIECVYDVSPRSLAKLEHLVSEDYELSRSRCFDLVQAIESTSTKLEYAEQELSQEIDENALSLEFNKYVECNKQLMETRNEITALHIEIKTKLRQAIKLGTLLSDRHRDAVKLRDRTKSLEFAERIRELLKTYRETSILKKIYQLEREFNTEFTLLSRKDRSDFSVKIDPNNFQIRFHSKSRGDFHAGQLSEGEKHVFAVAMLVALAKTSQRPLPIVIDSPLGRLDSEHSENLVRNYFPRIGHQVIVFSTDEEIDAEMYDVLSRQISRAYLIDFDDKKQESSIKTGYFTY